jgi:8-hydroxy-5-deazaflavin:NADPH oxidoreductase
MTIVSILGAGSVGRALAERFLLADCTVRFGARDVKTAAANLTGPLKSVATLPPAEASADADLIVVAVPAGAALEAVRAAGDLSKKALLDCTNPLRWDAGPVWTPPPEGSTSLALAAAFPKARVVKGFNHFGAEIQRDPALKPGPADAFFASDDAEAKAFVMSLAGPMGFRAHDAGPLRNSALLENLAVLWIHLAAVGGAGRDFAFRMERQRASR